MSEDETTQWVTAAYKARLASHILEQVHGPLPDSPLAADDDVYRWEKCSAWTRAALIAALDHLGLWANVVAPQTVFDGLIVQNPPRPYFTLARAGMEGAAQAVWVLDEDESSERVYRHLRLLYHDLRQMALAFQAMNDEHEQTARKRMEMISARIGDACRFESISKREPKYSEMLRECAPAIKMDPAELETLWRGASAAAHGKNWFQYIGYTTTVGDEYEPGYFRALLHPDPAEITRTVAAAVDLTMYGVMRFVTRAGYQPDPLSRAAYARLASETPLKDQSGPREGTP